MVEMALARGRATIRPWRVGLLVDTASTKAVRGAIADLSTVWGGIFMPILDCSATTKEIERLADLYDVDALYCDGAEGELKVLLARSGWRWRGMPPHGPFHETGGFRTGLLPVDALASSNEAVHQPRWPSDHPDDLAFAAIWGVRRPDHGDWEADEPADLELEDASLSAIAQTAAHVRTADRRDLDNFIGLVVIDAQDSTSVVRFWNMRMYGTELIGVPANADERLLSAILRNRLPVSRAPIGAQEGEFDRELQVWGLDAACTGLKEAVSALAARAGVRVVSMAKDDLPAYPFQGLSTRFKRSFRATFHPGALAVDVDLPELPLTDAFKSVRRGVVAADLRMHRVDGQDPRFTAALPPYRRLSSLLDYMVTQRGAEQARVTHGGQAIALDATFDHAPYSFAYNLEVFRHLFDEPDLTVDQSDEGRFQLRAAEKLGGPFAGILTHPGVRSALTLAAGRRDGVPMPHLLNTIERDRGAWPEFDQDVSGYARRQLNQLLHAGMFVPMLKVHCSHCRVDRWASADELGARMQCEFCGTQFDLALSHSLEQPAWRYRLAAHLGPEKVQALLPALATTSFLAHFRHVEEPPMAHVLGLKLRRGRDEVELDIATYVGDFDWLAVVGEVKTSNRIDQQDVINVERQEARLRANGVRTMSLFATLKDALGQPEINVLRERVERSVMARTARGRYLPTMPLVLTGADLSHPWLSPDHPWRWDDDEHRFDGLMGTAVSACKRNLGLRGYRPSKDGGISCEWDETKGPDGHVSEIAGSTGEH